MRAHVASSTMLRILLAGALVIPAGCSTDPNTYPDPGDVDIRIVGSRTVRHPRPDVTSASDHTPEPNLPALEPTQNEPTSREGRHKPTETAEPEKTPSPEPAEPENPRKKNLSRRSIPV